MCQFGVIALFRMIIIAVLVKLTLPVVFWIIKKQQTEQIEEQN